LLLLRYMKNTHGKTHNSYTLELVDLFDISKDQPYTGDAVGNKMLLWHGSRLTNWVGILSQGLRIAPPEAPCTGYMFGKGVYFAGMSLSSSLLG
jgi:poly [ADP-ribose] polymerase